MKIFEVIASTDFLLFLLGLFGIPLAKKVNKAIRKCDPRIFSYIFVITVYLLIAYERL